MANRINPPLNPPLNPILHADADEIARRVLAMMPSRPVFTAEEEAAFERERKAGTARYAEARHGALPPDTYRLLEQGSVIGWHFELEIDGDIVSLKEADGGPLSALDVGANKARAEELAREEVARRHGDVAAASASFRVMWGGEL